MGNKHSSSIGLLFMAILLNFTAWSQTRQIDPQTGKMGFADASGQIIIPMEYDFLPSEFTHLMVARKGDFKGVVDDKGRIRIPVEYYDIQLQPGGFAVATKDRSNQPVRGLLNSEGKVILPLMYQYVAVIDSHLLAARLFYGKEVKIFDAQGNLRCTPEGASAMPGFDDQSILMERANRTHYWTDLKGNPITPQLFANTVWSDGHYFIQDNGKWIGVVNTRGETVVPFQYRSVTPQNKGHFTVTDSTYRNYLVDTKGKTLIKGEIIRRGQLEGDWYSFRQSEQYTNKLFDATGKLIFDNCSLWPVITDPQWKDLPENEYYERYTWLDIKATQLRGFYRADGVQILPPNFNAIKYCTERHPLLAFSKDKNNNYGGNIYDLNGKLLLPQRYSSINFTEDPRIFFVQKTYGGLFGVLSLNAPEQVEWVYKRLDWLSNGYYTSEKGGLQAVLSPSGKELALGNFSTVKAPEPIHIQQFKALPGASGNLVAVITKPGMTAGVWMGLNDSGKTFDVNASPGDTKVVPVELTGLETPPESRNSGVYQNSEVSQPANFPSGATALYQYLGQQLKYPPLARENGIQGTVVIKFIVEKDGTISNIRMVRDIGGGCGQEALRLVSNMPKWAPGQKDGNPVRVEYVLPVKFKLE